MEIFDPILNFVQDFIQNSNPFLLVLTGLVLVAVLYLLFRLASNLIMRVLSCGCAILLLAGIAWVVYTFVL